MLHVREKKNADFCDFLWWIGRKCVSLQQIWTLKVRYMKSMCGSMISRPA